MKKIKEAHSISHLMLKNRIKKDPVLNIMIVDDDPLQVQLLVEIFSINNYSATGFQSATEAISFLETTPIDFLLSDIRMPGMDGVELCRKVKKIDPSIRVILMTAYADDELIQEGKQAGVLLTMAKPLDIDELLDQVVLLTRK